MPPEALNIHKGLIPSVGARWLRWLDIAFFFHSYTGLVIGRFSNLILAVSLFFQA